MRKSTGFAAVLAFPFLVLATPSAPPLKIFAEYPMPLSATGRFDHLEADLQGNRLFLAAESMHCVLILDLRTGKSIGDIPNIQIPHAIFLRRDLNRIYITDGGAGTIGGVRVYDGKTLHQTAFIPLKRDADSIAWDPQTKYLYVVNGGGDANEPFSMYSVIDTTSNAKLADIKVDGKTLEASVIDPLSPRIFVNNPSENEVDVINRETRSVETVWPIRVATKNVAMALDAGGHRLFVACRSGKIVVLDSLTGKELQTLDIGNGVDDLIFDPATRRIYASTGGGTGSTAVYDEQDPDHYRLLAEIPTAPGAKNEVLVPELTSYFTVVPPTQSIRGFVYAYRVNE